MRSAILSKIILTAVLCLSTTGCWSSIFGDGRDSTLAKEKRYRKINPDCSHIDLIHSEVSVPQFRELLHCFNSRGGLEEIENLVSKLSDAELLPLVRVGNEKALTNPQFLFEFQKSFESWSASGNAGPMLAAVGKPFENPEWFSSLLALMSRGDPKLFDALKLVGEKLTDANIARSLDVLLTIVDSPAFASIQKELKEPSLTRRGLDQVAAGIAAYFRLQRAPGRVELDRAFLSALANGQLFSAFDSFAELVAPSATGTANIREYVPRMAALMNSTLKPRRGIFGTISREAPVLQDLMSQVNGLHGPIRCMKGTQTMPDGVVYVIKELASRETANIDLFLRRNNLLTMVTMNSLCEFPPALADYYSAVFEMASLDTVYTATDLVKAFYKNGLSTLIVDTLGGKGYEWGEKPKPMSPVAELIPALAELSERGGMEDLLLLLASIRPEDREDFRAMAAFLVAPQKTLEGRSVYDALASTIANSNAGEMLNLLKSTGLYMDFDEPVFRPAVARLRQAFHMNNVHPVVHLIRELLVSPDLNRDFFQTLFLVASRNPDELHGALRSIGEMSREEDGRLREMTDSTVRIFAKFAAKNGTVPVVERGVPAFVPLRSHHFSKSDLTWVVAQPLRPLVGCEGLSPGIKLDDYESPEFESNFQRYIDCINSDGEHGDVQDGIYDYLLKERTEDGKPALHHAIDMLRRFSLPIPELSDIGKRWFGQFDDGRFFRFLDAIPWWTNRGVGLTRAEEGPLLEPLLQIVVPLVEEGKASWRRMEKFVAGVLKKDYFPKLLGYLQGLDDRSPQPEPVIDSENFDLEQIAASVGKQECIQDSAARMKRAADIVDDYRNSIVGPDLDPVTRRPRQAWKKHELMAEMDPLFEKLTGANGDVIGALLNTVGYFTLPEGEAPNSRQHFHWSYLRDFLKLRSLDHLKSNGELHTIPYFYPGEALPRLKVVSTLDRFELLVTNADFKYLLPQNFALEFLNSIALAWGDEPRESWPPLIKKLYPGSRRPPTLRDAYDDIRSTLKLASFFIGYPDVPECAEFNEKQVGVFPTDVKARLFNLHQLVGVIGENLPDAAGPYRGGMGVLRNLLFELYASTPEEFRSDSAKTAWKNNVGVGIKLARMGMFRQISKNMRVSTLPENHDSQLMDKFFDGFIHLGTACGLSVEAEVPRCVPILRSVLEALFSKDPELRLPRAVFDKMFDALDDSGRAARLKQLAFYSMVMGREAGVTEATLQATATLLTDYGDYFLKNSGTILKYLSSPESAGMVRALAEQDPQTPGRSEFFRLLVDVLAIPATNGDRLLVLDFMDILLIVDRPENEARWGLFKRRLEALDLTDYSKLKMDEIFENALEFFKEEPSTRLPGSPQSALKVRQYLADRLENGDSFQFMVMIKNDPERFLKMLSALSKYVENGEIKEFFSQLRRGVPKPSP